MSADISRRGGLGGAAKAALWALVVFVGCFHGPDFALVSIILPTIGQEFRVEPDLLQWMVSIYGLMSGGFLIFGGRVADLWGAKRVIIGALLISLLGIGLLVTAQSFPVALLARALMGLGAALAGPALLSLLVNSFAEGESRNKAVSFNSFFATICSSLGLLMGGILVAHFGWRPSLLPFAGFAAIALATATLALRQPQRTDPQRGLDVMGAVLLVSSAAALVFALSNLAKKGLDHPFVWGAGLGSFVGFALLALVERRVRNPMIDMSIFRIRNLTPSAAFGLLFMAARMPNFTLVTMLLLGIGGLPADRVGLLLVPNAVMTVAAGYVTPKVMARVSPRNCMIMGGLGVAGVILMMAQLPEQNPLPLALFAYAVYPFPAVLALTAMMVEGTGQAPPERRGTAAGILSMGLSLGLPIGMAIGLPALQRFATAGGRVSPNIQDFHAAFYLLAAISVAAAVFAFFFVRDHAPADRRQAVGRPSAPKDALKRDAA